LSKRSSALFVQSVSLPGCVPGASSSGLRSLTLVTCTPGMLFAASVKPWFSAITISGPVACFVFLPRCLPLPARMFLLAFTR